jgi:hypothetical protein
MSHQPPIPEAAMSPYPIHPAPVATSDAAKDTRPNDKKETSASGSEGVSLAALGVGAALGFGALAAIGRLLYVQRRKNSQAPRRAKDDKTKRGPADRRRVAVGEPYEVTYFARKHKISAERAREIIQKTGSDRKAANAMAAQRATGKAR